ncbi:MAG TPA: cytochrome c biogenesis protein CcsA [Acidimicrobiia bacterium]|nr:cytochrome c biogenesis protein CcsA [Acidimicrobiia bacterium]
MNRHRILGLSALVVIAIGFYFGSRAPLDQLQGEYTRIMYVHVPSAWLAYLAFLVTLVASILWLTKRRLVFDRVAESSVSIGVFFTALALMTGMIWGYPVWGTFWDWGDARMMTTALMFFVYVGYLALRRSIPDPAMRATRSAVLGIVAFFLVPLSYLSVLIVRTLHQGITVARPDSPIDGEILLALLSNVGAFTVVYLALMSLRTAIARGEEELEEQSAAVDATPAGAAITAPDLEGVRDV